MTAATDGATNNPTHSFLIPSLFRRREQCPCHVPGDSCRWWHGRRWRRWSSGSDWTRRRARGRCLANAPPWYSAHYYIKYTEYCVVCTREHIHVPARCHQVNLTRRLLLASRIDRTPPVLEIWAHPTAFAAWRVKVRDRRFEVKVKVICHQNPSTFGVDLTHIRVTPISVQWCFSQFLRGQTECHTERRRYKQYVLHAAL